MQNSSVNPQVSAVILAGGQGRRMGGQDKGLLLFKGMPLIEHLLKALKNQVDSVLINANRNQQQYQQYGVPVIGDTLHDYQGPLAGFMSAMQAAKTDYIMTLPCDGPTLPNNMCNRLYESLIQAQAELAVAHDGERLQPVHALLAVSLLPELQRFLASGDRNIDRWYAQHKMVTVDFSDSPTDFRNINTPEDQQALEKKLS